MDSIDPVDPVDLFAGNLWPNQHVRQLIQQLHRLLGAGDPGRGAHAPRPEVVGARAQELVAHVERVLRADLEALAVSVSVPVTVPAGPALLLKVLLAYRHAPGLVAYVDEDVAAAVAD
ncbi:hypothetical protein VP1G_10984 [Cytospora mali]|uniref:Uncharacterized protein n=1 Tax=Cytospora mali TaxID=578113 RepID=A0A194UZL1_CYTMA|nr:hypothetical protein VP1G_10984 [Valsa mali var. pyri (nom. inval.)]